MNQAKISIISSRVDSVHWHRPQKNIPQPDAKWKNSCEWCDRDDE